MIGGVTVFLAPQKLAVRDKQEGDSQYEDILTSAIMLATERLDGYVIPHTDIPYIMIVLRSLSELEWCRSKELQAASVLRVLVNAGLATYREIEARYGKLIGDIIYLADNEKFYQDCRADYWREEMERHFYETHERYMDIKQYDWRELKGIFACMEDSAMLRLLSSARKLHDAEFMRSEPPPPRFTWESDSDYLMCDACEECEDFHYRYSGQIPPGKDCNAARENARRSHDFPWYIKRGYTYVAYTCSKYEEAVGMCDDDYQTVRYRYTDEYMAYCDRCSEAFWQRFGLTHEEARNKLQALFPRISTEDELNDIIYYLIVTKYC